MKAAEATIAAVATPPGNGGVGIIRLSGPEALSICARLTGKTPPPRHAQFCRFRGNDGATIDSGLVLYFPAPASFTGEDVVELHGHGGAVVLNMLLNAVLAEGARLAAAGEFSRRAFLNNKIDLAQAEAIADLISSGTEQAARSAQQSLQGVFSDKITRLIEQLTELRVYTEAAIDFSDEDIDFLQEGDVGAKIKQLRASIHSIQGSARQGRLLHDGISVVLAGKPNAGKSSLLNALTGQEAAIVSAIPGTTRDVLRERIQIDGMPLHVIDTAGLRTSDNLIEQEGIRRAQREIEKADRILLLLDSRAPESADELADIGSTAAVTRIYNKIDLSGLTPKIATGAHGTEIWLSAKTGAGLDLLKTHLKQCAGFSEENQQVFTARSRHLDALARAAQSLDNALAQWQQHAPELLAEELRQAQNQLGEITGAFSSDDLLGEIFASFCIGK